MSLITESNKAYDLHHRLHMTAKTQVLNEVMLGEYLYLLKKDGLYKKAVGEGINKWVDYLKQPEVNITEHRAKKLIKVYEHFVIKMRYTTGQLEGVPLYALSYIADRDLSEVEKVDTMLDHARVLSEKDFKEQYHDEVVQGERTYTYVVMKKCVETGTMEKVHGISMEAMNALKEALNLD